MNFLNIGPGEMMAIIVIAILVIGPQRMVTFARSLGRILSRMRSISNEFLGSIQAELAETEQATREAVEHIKGASADVSANIEGTEDETSQALRSAKGQADIAAISIQEELRTFGQEAHQALKEVTEGFSSLVMSEVAKEEPGEEQDEEESNAA